MQLANGTRFGPYEIVAPLGAGGMGEVYKARDTRLDRTVAVKVLPSHIASRADLRQRFEREARAVSSLNHPNICTLFDIGRENGTEFMVMEHLEGETLADRLERGLLPIDQALRYAVQIADAIDRAHRSGVVHRDLKPGNIMITRDGIKVLDFGLAKGIERVAADGATLTVDLTGEATIVGTPQYMSPEQIEGRDADARTDIFAFGCVLYEMMTGKRAFDGKTKAGVIGAILATDPPPMAAVEPATPAAFDRLVRRCLAKDPEERWQSMRDLVLELRSVTTDANVAVSVRTRRPWLAATVLAASAAAIAVVLLYWGQTRAPELSTVQFLVHPPEGMEFFHEFAGTAVSPDGKHLVFSAGLTSASASLWVRPMNSTKARPLTGSQGGNLPFWAPDGKSLAYFAGGKLKRSDVSGGPSEVLCDVPLSSSRGGTWGRGGVILFATSGGLFRIPQSGGVAQKIAEPDTARNESEYSFPQFLPDGNRFLYFIASPVQSIRGIYSASLDAYKTRVRVLETPYKASLAFTGDDRTAYLMWLRDSALLAQKFDTGTLQFEGEPTRVVADMSVVGPFARVPFWTSDSAVLVYRAARLDAPSKLVWVGRDGKPMGDALKQDRYGSFRLSPDGSRLALSKVNEAEALDIWSFEFTRQVLTRLTFDAKNDDSPVWSPDGRRIAFYSDRKGTRQIYLMDATGRGQEQQVAELEGSQPVDWHPDGVHLLHQSLPRHSSALTLAVTPLQPQPKTVPVMQHQSWVEGAQFSPDGKWIAYAVDVSGRPEIYVRAFPPSAGEWQVSNEGGYLPKWRPDGKEIFYLSLARNAIMAADVRVSGNAFESDIPHELFRVSPVPQRVSFPYDIAPDGKRFLLMHANEEAQRTAPLTVVLNWHASTTK